MWWLAKRRGGTAWPRLLVFLGAVLLMGKMGAQTEGGKRLTHMPALDFMRSKVCQTCDLDGLVGDCGCEFDTVNQANQEHFMPLLRDLVERTFFRYFKVNLNKQCPFWHEEMMCSIRDCAVVECEAAEVPTMWIEQDGEGNTLRQCVGDSDTALSEIERILGTVDRKEARAGVDPFAPWAEGNNAAVWIEQDAEDRGMSYINLLRNPERFTGYAGPSARRVWTSIYENCFELTPEEMSAGDHCFEKRIFYRLIAGLQSSISTHLALDYYDQRKETWCPNTRLFVEKVGMHPERIHNLYFAYLFVMRAIAKAAPELMEYDYNTGNPEDDELVRSAMKVLARSSSNATSPGSLTGAGGGSSSAQAQCQRAFDESGMFRPRRGYTSSEEELHRLRQEFFVKFHNISRVMDCVGCEKCRLWGKLQTLGLGTAIKIVLGQPEDRTGAGGRFEFQRNEVIALINTAHQLAKSIKAVDAFQKLEFDEFVVHWLWLAGMGLIALGVLLGAARRLAQRRQRQEDAPKGNGQKKEDRRPPARAAGDKKRSKKA